MAPACSPWRIVDRREAGRNHTCAVKGDGSLFCWGAGDAGQIGDGRGVESRNPVRIGLPD